MPVSPCEKGVASVPVSLSDEGVASGIFFFFN